MRTAVRNTNDHRLKQAIVETANPDLFLELAIPESTRRTWMRRGVAEVISFDCADADMVALRATVSKLEKRIAILTAVVRLLVTFINLLDGTRCYLRGVIDGFSRRVLAWTLEPRLGAEGTRRVLREALAGAANTKVHVLTDGGATLRG